jgi:predicted lipase
MLRDAVSPLVREMDLQPKFQGQDSRFVAVMKAKDTIFIAFPGTHTWDDMIADIRVLQPDVLSEVGVHSGFYARFEETGCIEEIKKLVTGSPGMQVCFTGHSLGAAVAAIFTLHVLVGPPGQDRRRVRCVTFAQPLVGDVRLANYVKTHNLQDRFTVFINEFDIVPRLCLMESNQ